MANKRVGRMPKDHPEKVYERAQWMCEGCHKQRGDEIHHRRYLSRGGAHNLANLVLLCNPGGGGNGGRGCHAFAHSGEAPEGWAISAWESDSECRVPFRDLAGQVWMFTDDGKKEAVF